MRSSIGAAATLAFALTLPARAETTINKVTYGASTKAAPAPTTGLSPEAALRLKKIFLFPALDDLSGALAPKLDERLAELLNSNTRFELVRDPQVMKALSPDEGSYAKVAQNQAVHQEAARVTGADTTALLRVRNIGPNTQITLEFRDASGALLFLEEGSVPGASGLEARLSLVKRLYENLLGRLPFEGAVTGRTAATVTIDLGMGNLKVGEELEMARIVSVQRHPLLGTVVGTDYVRTGRARVTSVDRVLSFAEITEELAGERVAPGQKVLRARALVRRTDTPAGVDLSETESKAKRPRRGEDRSDREEKADPFEDRLKGEFDRPRARYGSVGASLYYGSLGHTQTLNSATTELSGSGIGGDLAGELWVTKNWIFSAGYGHHGASLSGEAGSAGASSWNEVNLAGGYRIFPENLAEGVTLTGNFGFQVISFDVASSAALAVGAKRYAGFFLRADAEVRFLEQQKLTVGFGIQPFSSFTETGPSLGSPSGATAIGLHLAWNRQLEGELWLRVGMRYIVANGNYENSSTVANKRFAIGPGIYYSF